MSKKRGYFLEMHTGLMDISPKKIGKALPLAVNKKDDTFFVSPPPFK
ncbi:MAG TPA: hypothetical protein PK695_11485 [Chitinophagaceae bacterium]|nr:hypothetical protein [Chitinophagaceae bacterium]HNF47404.1 hypothetical protein [Chitinophagaceae bacterium]HNJ25289.1 hypothetical protein [Chitinophagaceae bacterium]HNJ56877.1 hypothetical protein [Chitinophagaceae bacterium]HNK60561.1 hypothetical protein [Chitinophagaceae bacterium]